MATISIARGMFHKRRARSPYFAFAQPAPARLRYSPHHVFVQGLCPSFLCARMPAHAPASQLYPRRSPFPLVGGLIARRPGGGTSNKVFFVLRFRFFRRSARRSLRLSGESLLGWVVNFARRSPRVDYMAPPHPLKCSCSRRARAAVSNIIPPQTPQGGAFLYSGGADLPLRGHKRQRRRSRSVSSLGRCRRCRLRSLRSPGLTFAEKNIPRRSVVACRWVSFVSLPEIRMIAKAMPPRSGGVINKELI